jgi:hypothetical protein
MAETPQRGTNVMRQWLLNGIFTICLAICGLYFNGLENQRDSDRNAAQAFQAQRLDTDAEQNRKIAVLETKIENMKETLERMERKIDMLPARISR